MSKNSIEILGASEKDIPLVHSFIRGLAEFDGHLDRFTLTESELHNIMFGKERGLEGLIAYVNKQPLGFAVYFHNFPTFSGRRALFIEDLFVYPDQRGNGIGKALLKKLAQIAIERNCCRLEWWTMNWNSKAREFYKKLGAQTKEECLIHILDGEALNKLAT